MLLTEEQRLLLKTNESESRGYLSIYRPTTLLACQVNMAEPYVGAVGIVFDNVTAGAYTNVFKWATVLVGTEAGKNDVATIWARECSATTLIVGLNSINWQNDLYITVLNFVDVWNRPFSFYFDGEQIIYEIDGDTAFASTDAELGTFVNMGSNYAGFVGDKVNWDASASENVGGNSVSYVWNFEGGDISIHSGSVAGDVTYNTAGHYKTKLTATASNGYVNVGYRYVSIYDRTGVNSPNDLVLSNDFSGNRNEGGWIANVMIGQDSVAGIIAGLPAVIFAEHNVGGQDLALFNILFSGYVIEKTGSYNHVEKSAEFLLGSGHERMMLRPMTQISVDSVALATAWYQVTDMTVKKFLYYYLNYYTTALACFDIRIRNGFTTNVRYFETEAISIYENLVNIINKTRGGLPVFDRQGTMWVEYEPSVPDSYCTNVSGTFLLEDDDFLGEVYIEEALHGGIGSLQIGGFIDAGAASGSNTPVLSESPDTSYIYYFGTSVNRQGFAIVSQDELNVICGNIYAHENAVYKHVETTLFGMYLNFDIAPLECIPVSVSSDKNNLGISWNNKSFYCKEASLDFMPDSLSILYKLILHEVTQGFAGETLVIPQPIEENIDPGVDPGDFPIFPMPNINFPPFVPTLPPIDPNCRITANGAYKVYPEKFLIFNSLVFSERTLYLHYPCEIRDSGDYPTKLRLVGLFQKKDGSTWKTYNTDNDYFTVEAINESGGLVASTASVYDVNDTIKDFTFSVGGHAVIWGFKVQIKPMTASYSAGDLVTYRYLDNVHPNYGDWYTDDIVAAENVAGIMTWIDVVGNRRDIDIRHYDPYDLTRYARKSDTIATNIAKQAFGHSTACADAGFSPTTTYTLTSGGLLVAKNAVKTIGGWLQWGTGGGYWDYSMQYVYYDTGLEGDYRIWLSEYASLYNVCPPNIEEI